MEKLTHGLIKIIFKKCFRVLTAAELDLFERGDPESINPELGVDEQADLLPYNRY